MNPTDTNQIDCLLDCKHTLTDCEARQVGRWRYSNPKDHSTLNLMFISCKNCKYWLTDREYEDRATKFNRQIFWMRGKHARKSHRKQDLTTQRSTTPK